MFFLTLLERILKLPSYEFNQFVGSKISHFSIDWRDFKSKDVAFEDKFKGVLQFLSHSTIFKNLKLEI
jgi:hypothetical protein